MILPTTSAETPMAPPSCGTSSSAVALEDPFSCLLQQQSKLSPLLLPLMATSSSPPASPSTQDEPTFDWSEFLGVPPPPSKDRKPPLLVINVDDENYDKYMPASSTLFRQPPSSPRNLYSRRSRRALQPVPETEQRQQPATVIALHQSFIKKHKKSVRFAETLQVRTYPLILGQHPCCLAMALECDWTPESQHIFDLNEFEAASRKRTQGQLRLDYAERRARLCGDYNDDLMKIFYQQQQQREEEVFESPAPEFHHPPWLQDYYELFGGDEAAKESPPLKDDAKRQDPPGRTPPQPEHPRRQRQRRHDTLRLRGTAT